MSNRFKSYFDTNLQKALDRVPQDRRVISILPQRNAMEEYFEVVTEVIDLANTSSETNKRPLKSATEATQEEKE